MKKFETERDFFPDYPGTLSYVRKLACDWYSTPDHNDGLWLHYSNSNGVLKLATDELMAMNRPGFITPYQRDSTVLTQQEVLLAIKMEFRKEIIYATTKW